MKIEVFSDLYNQKKNKILFKPTGMISDITNKWQHQNWETLSKINNLIVSKVINFRTSQ